MQKPISINFGELDWQPHPTIPGIQTKFIDNSAAFPPRDLLIATVAIDSEIPWHVHETDSELAYVIHGDGILLYSADQSLQDVAEFPIPTGSAVIVPPNVWHCVCNTGGSELRLLAAHMRQT
jgi:mannose-6-phosphate isomerase-like protein (cupin superfamily)